MIEGGPAAFGARPPHQAYLMGRPHGGAGIPIVPQTCTKVHTVKTILRKEKFRAVQKNFSTRRIGPVRRTKNGKT